MSDKPEEWWDCPECGGDTQICVGPSTGCKRECINCSWEYRLSNELEGYKIHPYDNWNHA